MLNLRVPNGHIVEVQLGIESLMLLRSWDHPMYQIARTQSNNELIEVVRSQAESAHRPVLEADYEDMAVAEPDVYRSSDVVAVPMHIDGRQLDQAPCPQHPSDVRAFHTTGDVDLHVDCYSTQVSRLPWIDSAIAHSRHIEVLVHEGLL